MSPSNKLENEKKIEQVVQQLTPLLTNKGIPRSLRNMLKETLDQLQDNSVSPAIRAANTVSVLEEVSQDPNIPSHIRVLIWNMMSLLETIRETS
ncbi:MAG: hypothetical protein GU362_03425 [Thaumarchaeota archaeon]|jgi:uncharacterized protein (UPF0147 family)|nr:hypothetical protein [Nitrososphaerota archaeon]